MYITSVQYIIACFCLPNEREFNLLLTARISDRTKAKANGNSPFMIPAILPIVKYGHSGRFIFMIRNTEAG